ncbi:hypothetical protein ATE71_05345 [Sphingopyxis sp. H115]|nr:hypothetical protein ATE71_05345 [Sphingopyxis sp. H115]
MFIIVLVFECGSAAEGWIIGSLRTLDRNSPMIIIAIFVVFRATGTLRGSCDRQNSRNMIFGTRWQSTRSAGCMLPTGDAASHPDEADMGGHAVHETGPSRAGGRAVCIAMAFLA